MKIDGSAGKFIQTPNDLAKETPNPAEVKDTRLDNPKISDSFKENSGMRLDLKAKQDTISLTVPPNAGDGGGTNLARTTIDAPPTESRSRIFESAKDQTAARTQARTQEALDAQAENKAKADAANQDRQTVQDQLESNKSADLNREALRIDINKEIEKPGSRNNVDIIA